MRKLIAICGFAAVAITLGLSAPSGARERVAANPIQHVVIVYMENHTFDNVLGKLCVVDARCDGATSGKISTGGTIPLAKSPDLVPGVSHDRKSQETGMDGGLMDGFDLVRGCDRTGGYKCYTQYDPSQIPNLASLARAHVISDATFENSPAASFVSHIILVASNTDRFWGDNPRQGKTTKKGPGWGCNSFRDALWTNSSGSNVYVPSCVPDATGGGPYRSSPVAYERTIMDLMEGAGLSWKLYSAKGPDNTQAGYIWAPCTYFYECLSTQKAKWLAASVFLSDAAAGTLPNLSLITPLGKDSQHNNQSMAAGDNWIGSMVQAVMNGPDWPSTTIFITYDDAGGLYDHAPPPPGRGIRVPMVIVSPYARPGFTDSASATLASMLAYVEHTFGLGSLSLEDANAYDFANSFDYSQVPLGAVSMVRRKIPAWEQRWIKAHPVDPDDPT